MNLFYSTSRLTTLALSIGFLSISAQAYAEIKYEVINLGTLGGSSSRAFGINNSGQVTGYSQNASGYTGYDHAFIYRNGTMTDLGTLSGNYSYGYDINDSGQVTGRSYNYLGSGHAIIYENGTMTDLGTLSDKYFPNQAIYSSGQAIYSSGQAINNNGQVTGYSFNDSEQYHAFIYENGIMTDLGTLGGSRSYGRDINNNGQITGSSQITSGESHAFIYENGTMTDIGSLVKRNSSTSGMAINDSAQVVGYSYNYYDSLGRVYAFIYENGTMTDIGNLGGYKSYGSDINNNGQVVGYSTNALDQEHAFLWDENKGMLDLNDLIDPNAGVTLVSAIGINDAGQIIGNGIFDGIGDRAFLLNPVTEVPEPPNLALMLGGLGLISLIMSRRKKT